MSETTQAVPGVPSLLRRIPVWLVVLSGVCLATLCYYLPALGPGGRAAVYLGTEVAAIAAVAVSIGRRSLARPLAWVLIGVGMAFLTAGDAVWYAIDLGGQSVPTPSVADAFYLAEYPFLIAGAISLVRRRPERSVVLDALLVSVGAAVAIWEFLVRPILGDPSQTLIGTAISAAYPVADFALLAVLTGVLFNTGLPSMSLRLLAAGFLLTFLVDVAYLRWTLVDTVPDPSLLDAGWLVSMGLWAAAAAHPSARDVVRGVPRDWRQTRTARLALLSTACVLVPLTLAAQAWNGEAPDLPLLVTAWMAMVIIVAFRAIGITGDIRRSEDRFRAIFEGSPVGMGVARGTRVLMTNASVRAMVRSDDPQVLLDRPLTDLVVPGERAGLLDRLQRPDGDPDTTAPFETVGLRIDGSTFPLVVYARPISLSDGRAIAWFFVDITRQREAETTLLASERRYRQVFESNPQPMWVYDSATFRFLAVNDRAVHHYGWSRDEFLAMTIVEIRPEADVPGLLENIWAEREAVQSSGPWRHRRKDGSVIEVEITSHDIDWEGRQARLVLALDVTERLGLEEALRQAQKMEAIGRLAGGVAHDFNNLLTAIAGYAEVLHDDLGDDDPREADVAAILRASDRAASLTRQLLAFSRRQVLQPQVLDLNAAVLEVRSLLARLIGEDVGIRTHLAEDLVPVTADPVQITQVLMNLAVNARDAMPHGGTLSIETGNVVVDEDSMRTEAGTRPGLYALLAVTDTGNGMDADALSHVFEPFFTTKPVGQGTGLGLATVYGIVKQSGGSIRVDSEPGRGTRFRVYLPAAAPEAHGVAIDVERPADGAAVTETILLVEDEEAVRSFVARILERRGYRVLAASTADRAEAVAAAHPGRIDLMLSDVVMPGRNGPALAASVRAARPGIRTLFMSGYTQDAIAHDGVLDEGVTFIEKPFTSARLLAKIREVLETPVILAHGD